MTEPRDDAARTSRASDSRGPPPPPLTSKSHPCRTLSDTTMQATSPESSAVTLVVLEAGEGLTNCLTATKFLPDRWASQLLRTQFCSTGLALNQMPDCAPALKVKGLILRLEPECRLSVDGRPRVARHKAQIALGACFRGSRSPPTLMVSLEKIAGGHPDFLQAPPTVEQSSPTPKSPEGNFNYNVAAPTELVRRRRPSDFAPAGQASGYLRVRSKNSTNPWAASLNSSVPGGRSPAANWEANRRLPSVFLQARCTRVSWVRGPTTPDHTRRRASRGPERTTNAVGSRRRAVRNTPGVPWAQTPFLAGC